MLGWHSVCFSLPETGEDAHGSWCSVPNSTSCGPLTGPKADAQEPVTLPAPQTSVTERTAVELYESPWEGLQQYELRHYFASVVIAAGASFSESTAYLGNSEGEVRRTYAHLVRQRADEIRRAAGSIIHAQEMRS